MCGISDSINAVIVMRALQGSFASTLIPCSFALVGNVYSGVTLQKAIGGLIMARTSRRGFSLVIAGSFGISDVGCKGVYYFSFTVSVLCFLVFVVICLNIPRSEMFCDFKRLRNALVFAL